ncbi:hypothetical protein D3H65_02250 [Paraflavitalea soli]|uniref:DUF2214 family protein n=1 Tax=Paraflavitalea soli TaxID=2315862 RepID=A0A3B7MQH7_9BACT|nr:hypothetical protein [Paraflavitalea soli]AXY72861.1 hypothetical protein D3H65_02250 [Paraflavitalea soli]
MIYHASLWFHIIGITLLAGTTFVDFVLTRKFWAFYAKDQPAGMVARKLTEKLPLLVVAGIVLTLLSGIGMMTILHAVIGAMLWFRIKIILVVIVILNGIVVGRKLNGRLNKMLTTAGTGPANDQSLQQLKKNLQLFHITQLTIFFIIFFLSAFKFN